MTPESKVAVVSEPATTRVSALAVSLSMVKP